MRRPAPIPLSRETDFPALTCIDPCDRVIILGSFWPYSTHSLESCIVKCFKQCHPVDGFQPEIGLLCEIYVRRILEKLGTVRFGWVARALSSSECKPDQQRPLALLESILCRELGADSLTRVFFRSEPRPPMRMVGPLSGRDALMRRLRYAAQDLFIVPENAGGSVLFLDDICNTGASARLYCHVLKRFAGAESVTCANLAATRFSAGKDGRGRLSLDTAEFEGRPEFGVAWLDSQPAFHTREDCPGIVGRPAAKLTFLAERTAPPCPVCRCRSEPKKRFLGLFG